MIIILDYKRVFLDVFHRDPIMPKDFLASENEAQIRKAIKDYSGEHAKELSSLIFDTWTEFTNKMNNERKSLPGCFYIKEIK